MQPSAQPAPPAAGAPVERAAARTGALAVPILLYSLVAFLAGLPLPRAAAALSASIGLCAGLLVRLQNRRTLCIVWAELTAWIGVAFLIATAWNLLHAPTTLLGVLDVALGIAVVRHGFGLVQASRLLPG